MDQLILDIVEQDGEIDALIQRILDGFDEVPVPSDIPAYQSVPLAIALKDGEGSVEGGVTGHSVWGWLYVRYLWVAAAHRGGGHGTRLLDAAENAARERACTGVWLSTYSFQASAFYEKLGYAKCGQIDDFPKGQSRLFYQKRLIP